MNKEQAGAVILLVTWVICGSIVYVTYDGAWWAGLLLAWILGLILAFIVLMTLLLLLVVIATALGD